MLTYMNSVKQKTKSSYNSLTLNVNSIAADGTHCFKGTLSIRTSRRRMALFIPPT